MFPVCSLGNLLWFILGGGILALVWLVIAPVFSITIIGVPIGRACFEFAKLSAFPYGKEIIKEEQLKSKKNISGFKKIVALVLNIIWFPIGLILTFVYLILAVVYAITTIRIPVAVVYVRMGAFLLNPIESRIVTKKQALASSVINEMERRAGSNAIN